MATYLLDLNDTELTLFHDGRAAARSVGYALIRGNDVVFGEEAQRQFRRHPRQANNQYWHRLSMDPLPVRARNLGNLADLVYRHLGELAAASGIGADDELMIAAAGTVSADQLGLLLGVIGELSLRVTGLVDTAVAQALATRVPDDAAHLDVALHRATVTLLDGAADGGASIGRSSARDMPELGLSHLVDAWVNVVADRFVSETRFDPLRIADTEQQVYNQLIDWISSPGRATELVGEVNHGNVPRRVGVSSGALIERAGTRYRLLHDALDPHRPVVLSHRAARLPGLRERLLAEGSTVLCLEPDALWHGLSDRLDTVRSEPDALKFVARLPTGRAPSASVPAAAARSAVLPTHVVHRGWAWPVGVRLQLGRERLPAELRRTSGDMPELVATIERANDAMMARPTGDVPLTLNGRSLTGGTELRPGDVLVHGDHEFTFVRVTDATAT